MGTGRGGRITNVGINWPAVHIGHPSLASWPLLKGDPKNLIGIDGLNPSHYMYQRKTTDIFHKNS